MMKFQFINNPLALALVTAFLMSTPCFAGEPVRVFILAGQSNTVGHARAHTIATLFASETPRDQELLNMV
ncbi:MAG: hypothetical protein VXZ53_25525, partial [Planctomycetota bacterium]|nr:hypothetical protein [Planctomycetota bacterium]